MRRFFVSLNIFEPDSMTPLVTFERWDNVREQARVGTRHAKNPGGGMGTH